MGRPWQIIKDKLADSKALMWIVVGGMLLRLAYAAYIYPDFLPGDAHYYWLEAQNWLDGNGLEFYWPPGLIVLLLPFVKLPFGSLIFSLLIWTLFVLAWEKATVDLDRWKRNLGHLFFAIFPAFIHQSVIPLSHLPIATGLLWLFFLLKNPSPSRLFGTAMLFAFLGLIRPGVWALTPLFILFLIHKKFSATYWIAAILVFLMLPFCWEIYAYQQLGRWVKINEANAYNLYLGNHPQAHPYRTWWLGSHDVSDEAEFADFQAERDSIRNLPKELQASSFQSKATNYITADPWTFTKRMGTRFRNFWAFDTLTSATLLNGGRKLGYVSILLDGLLFLICLFAGIWSMVNGNFRLLGMVFLYQLPYLLAFAHPTYHFPLLPLMIWAALREPFHFSRKKILLFLIILMPFLLIQVEWGLDLLSRNS